MFTKIIQGTGWELGIIAIFVAGTIWLMKILVNHFIKQANQITDERKSITERYEHFLENHISENTKALIENSKVITQLIDHLHRLSESNHKEHIEIIDRLRK